MTPSGLTSIPAGMETPDMIELRKRKNIEDAMESGSEQPTLYTVLPEKRAGVGAMMMGSSHVYDLASVRIYIKIIHNYRCFITPHSNNPVSQRQSTLFQHLFLLVLQAGAPTGTRKVTFYLARCTWPSFHVAKQEFGSTWYCIDVR